MFLKMYLVFCGIIFSITSINGKHVCSSDTVVSIQADTVEFIETPDFPRILTEEERSHCFINFTKTLLPGEKNKSFRLLLTHVICGDSDGVTQYECGIEDIHIQNMTSFNYSIESNILSYQGYAIYEDWEGDGCPLQSVTRIDPFHFTDKFQTLYLEMTSVGLPYCFWQFTAPPKYWFKIVIFDMKYSLMEIKTHHELISVDKNIDYDGYHIYGGYVSLKVIRKDFASFQAYISIVNYDEDKVETNCSISNINNIITWTNLDTTNGYPPNARCTYDCLIKENTEIIVTKKQIFIENYMDRINFYPNGITNSPIDLNFFSTFSDQIALANNKYGTDRHVFWEFVSDDNWQSLGFEITFEKIECQCSKTLIIIPCQETYNFTIMDNSNFYCGNLECNYTIKINESCPEKNINMKLEFYTYVGEEIFDVFKVFSNNVSVLEVNHSNRINLHFSAFLPSIAENIFQVITVPSLYYRTFSANFYAIEPQLIPKIVLTQEKPYHIFYMCCEKVPFIFEIILSDELISKRETIDVHSVNDETLAKISFFSTTNLAQEITFKNCFVTDTTYKYVCKTNVTKIVVLQTVNTISTEGQVLLFQASSVSSEGCLFQNNLIKLDGTRKVTSVISNTKTWCTIFILVQIPGYSVKMKNIWLSPTSKNITIFAGSDEKELITINANTASSWHNIFLKSFIYVCKISPNTAVLFNIDGSSSLTTQVSIYPYRSIYTSMFYGEKPPTSLNHYKDRCLFLISRYNVKFTILYYNVSSDVHYYFETANYTRINITSKLDSIIFSNANISISHECGYAQKTCPGDFVIMIESLDDNNYELYDPLPTIMYTAETREITEITISSSSRAETNNKNTNITGSNCAALSIADGKWKAEDCFKPKPFVCATSAAPTYPISANCSNGWTYIAATHSCYGVEYPGLFSSWSEAENDCQSFGAHLSSIHSNVELQHLASYLYMMSANVWTGIYSPDSGLTWKISDESEVDFLKYANWCGKRPATNITGQRCVTLSCCSCYYDLDCTTTAQHALQGVPK